MDVTTLGYALLSGLSLFTADSIVHADPYSLRVEVHEDAQRSGYTRQYVENYFAFEMKRIFRHESAVKAVSARAAGEPSVAAALADPLGADKLRFALRNLFQVDPISLEIYIVPVRDAEGGEDVRAVGFGSRPGGDFFEFDIRADRRLPQVFLGETAMRAALTIDRYHARLAQARAGTSPEDTRKLAAELAAREAGAAGRDEAELTHLEAVIAFRDGDIDRAETLFKRALALEPTLVAAQANLSLVDLLRGRHLPSVALAREAEDALTGESPLPAKAQRVLRGAIYIAAASNAEAVLQPRLAETLWQRACADLPQLGHLLSDQHSPWLPARTVAACWTRRDREVIAGYEAYGWELVALAPLPAAARLAE